MHGSMPIGKYKILKYHYKFAAEVDSSQNGVTQLVRLFKCKFYSDMSFMQPYM